MPIQEQSLFSALGEMMNCPACGYPNDSNDHRCEKCGIRFAGRNRSPVTASSARTPAPPGSGHPVPPWRSEVSERVARYRKRRAVEATLPLEFPDPEPKVIPFPSSPSPVSQSGTRHPDPSGRLPASHPGLQEAPTGERQARTGPDGSGCPAPLRPEPEQPALDFSTRTVDFPVAPLWVRAAAGGADAAMVAIGYGLLFLAYHLAGGHLPWQRSTLLAALAVLGVLPFFYLSLFLLLASETPGMRWCGLRLVDFYGRPASRSRRLGRVLASVASAGSILLGFFWAVMDDEHLTWHDRMSETCLLVATRGPLRKRSRT